MFDSNQSIRSMRDRGFSVQTSTARAIEQDAFQSFAPVHVAIPFRFVELWHGVGYTKASNAFVLGVL